MILQLGFTGEDSECLHTTKAVYGRAGDWAGSWSIKQQAEL